MGQHSHTKPATIYALCHPETGEVRYIGKTVDLAARQYQHRLSPAKSRVSTSAVSRWIASLASQGFVPEMRVLETVCGADAKEAEQRHIDEHYARGCNLTNKLVATDGERGRKLRNVTVPLSLYAELERRAEASGHDIGWVTRDLLRKALQGS